jgi:thymidine phosphorylase
MAATDDAGPPSLTPAQVIARKRDGLSIERTDLQAFAQGLADGRVSDAQAGAFAMAVLLRGLDAAETVSLTLAMRDSGEVLRWHGLDGPVLDKHSTGGVGDTVSLLLGPLLAACGAHVPMVSGRGLGHTGGTLDKLESIPGYTVQPDRARLRRVVRESGVAIVGADDRLAPADRRLYAVRDVTGTVESAPLIVASILSKKLAAGLQGLVMDVKVGNGAFLPDADEARALARLLASVGQGAGLPVRGWLTAMDQPLADAAGNALEVRVALDHLCGRRPPDRLLSVTMGLAADALVMGGLASDPDAARQRLEQALVDGSAADRFARMVHGLGGPSDLLASAARLLPVAPVQQPVLPLAGEGGARRVVAIDVRALGWAVVRLGGGRLRDGDPVDPRVGLSGLAALGATLAFGEPLAWVHAADEAAAERAVRAVRAAFRLEPVAVEAALPPGAAGLAPLVEAVDARPTAGTARPPAA